MRKINDMELIARIPEGPTIVDDLTIDERYKRSRECVNACATLKDPVKDIRDLVLAAREALDLLPDGLFEQLDDALSKFNGVK